MHPPFPKGDIWRAKIFRGIILTSITAKIYNALLDNCTELKSGKILKKIQNGFRRNRSTTSQIVTIRRILEGVRAKKFEATILFVAFSKTFEFIHRGKIKPILLAAASQRNRCSHNDAIWKHESKSPLTGCRYRLLRHCNRCATRRHISRIPVYHLPRLRAWNICKFNLKNSFKLAMGRSRRYTTQTITDVDYADDIALLAKTPSQIDSLLYSLERAASGIPPCQHRHNSVLIKGRHLHTKW